MDINQALEKRRILINKYEATNSAIASLEQLNKMFGDDEGAYILYVAWLNEASDLHDQIRALNEYCFKRQSTIINTPT